MGICRFTSNKRTCVLWSQEIYMYIYIYTIQNNCVEDVSKWLIAMLSSSIFRWDNILRGLLIDDPPPGRRVDDALLATLPRLRLVAVAFTGAVMGLEDEIWGSNMCKKAANWITLNHDHFSTFMPSNMESYRN